MAVLLSAEALLPAASVPTRARRLSRVARASSEQSEADARRRLATPTPADGDGERAPAGAVAGRAAEGDRHAADGRAAEVGGEDIIQRYVKQRDDWWSDGLFSSPLAKTGGGGDGRSARCSRPCRGRRATSSC